MQETAINAIRHSLSAASAALDLLEQVQAPAPSQPEQIPEPQVCCTQECVAVCTDDDDDFNRLYEELSDSQFNLRTVAELTRLTGMILARIKFLLEDNDVGYVCLTRHSDSAPLIGLASRN